MLTASASTTPRGGSDASLTPRSSVIETPRDSSKSPRRTALDKVDKKSVEEVLRIDNGCRAGVKGDLRRLRTLVSEGLDINTGNYDRRTPLHLAANHGHMSMIEFMIDRMGADVRVKDRWGGTPLDDAIRCKKDDVVAFLQKKGAPIGKMSSLTDDSVDLCDAGFNGDIDRLKGLINCNADVNMADYDGRTAIHLACSEGKLKCVKHIVEKMNGDQNVKDRWGGTPKDDAIRHGHDDVFEYLEKRGALRGKTASMNAADATDLCSAATKEDLVALRDMYRRKVDVNTGDYDQRTAMHLACAEGKLAVVKCLVQELKADVNVVDRWGGTPLDDAMRTNHKEIVDFLKANKAKRGKTALYSSDGEILCKAAATGDTEGLNGLMQLGLNVSSPNYDNRTALHLAAAEGNLQMVKLLVEKFKANLNLMDKYGNTPFDDATRAGHEAIAVYLKSKGASIGETKSKDRIDAWRLLEAAAAGRTNELRMLSKQGVNINTVDYDKRTPLHLAASKGHVPAVKCLVEELQANLNAVDISGTTPLGAAMGAGYDALVNYLEAKGGRQGTDSPRSDESNSGTKTGTMPPDNVCQPHKMSKLQTNGNSPPKQSTGKATATKTNGTTRTNGTTQSNGTTKKSNLTSPTKQAEILPFNDNGSHPAPAQQRAQGFHLFPFSLPAFVTGCRYDSVGCRDQVLGKESGADAQDIGYESDVKFTR